MTKKHDRVIGNFKQKIVPISEKPGCFLVFNDSGESREVLLIEFNNFFNICQFWKKFV